MTESNIKPVPLTVRKAYIKNGVLTLFLYLHTNIEKETRHNPDLGAPYEIYVYHMTQLSIPVSLTLFNKLNLTKTEDPTWHQRPIRHLLTEKLPDLVFRQGLAESLGEDNVRKIDWRDKQHAISDEELTQIKTFVKLGGLVE